jgi:peptide/nickel transport system permease protein
LTKVLALRPIMALSALSETLWVRLAKRAVTWFVFHALPVLLIVIIASFILIQLAPGSFIDVLTSELQVSDPAVIEHLKKIYGYDQPPYIQLLKYINSVAHLDFGFSYRQNEPVLHAILARLPASLTLMLAAIIVAVGIGVSAGVAAAVLANTVWDRIISLISVFFFAAPGFWLGIMLIVLFSVKLGWFPVGDMYSIGLEGGPAHSLRDVLWHLTLPAVTLGVHYAAIYARITRSTMLTITKSEFVKTAYAKGLSRSRIVVAHILRNALLPVVTLLGLQFANVLSGAIIVESVFSWPGVGSLLYDAVNARDFPVVLGVLIFGSSLVIFVNLVVDLVYVRLDPRVTIR